MSEQKSVKGFLVGWYVLKIAHFGWLIVPMDCILNYRV